MYTKFLSFHSTSNRERSIFVLSGFWCVGLMIGILLAAFSPGGSEYLLAALSNRHMSFLVFLINGLPLVVVALALFCSLLFALYPVFFLHAMSRGFCAIFALCTLGTGAWLIRCLFLFSGCCTSVLMWFLLFRHIRGKRIGFFWDVYLTAIASSFISLVDIYFISPLLIDISKYF